MPGRVHAAILWIAYAAGTAASVALPGKFWPHYYQLWLPVLAIAGGIGIEAVGQLFRSFRSAATARPLPSVHRCCRASSARRRCSSSPCYELPYFRQSAESWSRAKYGDIFVETKRAAARDRQPCSRPARPSSSGATRPGLYYYTRRHPPSGIFYVSPVIVRTPQRDALASGWSASSSARAPSFW